MPLEKNWLDQDKSYMEEAVRQAENAKQIGEVPIGAVLVKDGEIISKGYNLREQQQLSTAHAEIIVIEDACRKLGTWRLEDCVLYVTLEPCPMCAGAIVQARLKRVVFGATDPKGGCCGTIMNLLDEPRFNHSVLLSSGILEEECSLLLTEFFQDLRKRKKSLGN
ncbi:tRNA adenosine(34) deaminase TadA [Evansella tamaricis]|uniref:tRNA-specific adenosine deaminase n=1 Tax=Evansella tamaricis TaxID=2069301 RepID=A0ABS6JDX1_9BACI|nr:tRNA adenosine(34) deaminase TadA [Evansella tamaricis]MBU9710645.1 tRNA adenosine(34) deaminase TadA [Evansella tamaricis]